MGVGCSTRNRSHYFDGTDGYRFVSEHAAREWLLGNGHDNAVSTHFDPVEEERGPGRPEIGKPINVRLGDDLLAEVDRFAADTGRNRAEAIRRLVAIAVRGC